MILGLTGSNASGKGEVASYLSGRGFAVHSLSDVVREEAAAKGVPPDREHLIRIGNELRRRGGPGVLAERIVPRLGRRDVVDSIRNPAEVEVLRRLPHFTLLGVTAPVELRYGRALARGRPGDPRSLEEFRSREEQENSLDPTTQRLRATFALADRVIRNDRSLERLHAELERVITELEACGRR